MNKQDMIQTLQPYLFFLTEGNLEVDMMNYSLMMLSINCGEVIRSPQISSHKILQHRAQLSSNTLATRSSSFCDFPLSESPANFH